MSHVVTIKTEIRDPAAVAGACRRMGLQAPTQQTVQMWSATRTGLAVQLKGWRYPLVLTEGTLHYDNYEGRWGKQAELDRFMQSYAIEKATIEARREGHTVTETSLPDGSVKLTIQV